MNIRARKPRYLSIFFCVIILALTFNLFHNVPPFGIPIQNAWLVLVVLLIPVVLFYVHTKAYLKRTTSGLILYSYLLIIWAVCSAVVSTYSFSQPVFFGLVTGRFVFHVFVFLIFVALLDTRRITNSEFIKAFVVTGWLCLFLFMMTQFAYSGLSFGSYRVLARDYGIRFNFYFVSFCTLYYVIDYLVKRKIGSLVKAFPFFLYLTVVTVRRAAVVALFISLLVYIIMKFDIVKSSSLVLGGAVLSFLVMAISYLLFPDQIQPLVTLFNDAFIVVFGGGESGDISANARLTQIELVWGNVVDRIWLGHGTLSFQWSGEEGYFRIFDTWFYPRDIGVVGVLYQFGIVGGILLLAQFVFPYKWYKEIPANLRGVYVDSIGVFILYLFVESLGTGTIFASPWLVTCSAVYLYDVRYRGIR